MLDDLQMRVNDLAQILGLPVSLTTPELQSIVFSPHSGAIIDTVRSKSLLSRDTDDWVVRWFRKAGVGGTTSPVFVPGIPEKEAMSRWVVPVHTGTRIIAFLCILDPDGSCTMPALTAVSGQVGEISRIMQAAEESAMAAGAHLRQLLTGTDSEKSTAAVELFDRGNRTAQSWTIAVTATLNLPGHPLAGGSRAPEPMRGATLAAGAGIVTCKFEDHHAFLMEAVENPPNIQVLADLTPCCPRPLAAAGSAVQHPMQLARSYHQACGALRSASVQRTPPPMTAWNDLGPIKVLALQTPEVLADITHDKINALTPSGAELIDTVAHYLEQGRKPDLVANSLHIHRGTLYYRLRKFEDATGLNLESGSDRLTIQLSLEALKLLNAPKWQHALS
jgi:hypothetical protein